MAEIIDIRRAKIARICVAERSVQERLSRVLEHINLTDGERAVALNTATWRVRCGGQPKTAEREAIGYARRREDEHNRRMASDWYRLGEHGFVPAWSGPDDAA